MKLKKLLVLLMVFCLAFSLVACSNGGNDNEENNEESVNTINSIEDLPGKIIGVQLGTTGDIYASDYEAEGSTIERYNKGVDAVQSLLQGKIDCVIIDEQPAKVFVEKNEGKLKILEEDFKIEDYAICIAKDNTDLKDKFNEAIKTLKENGTLQQIINNYIGDDTKGTCPYVTPEGTSYPNGKLVMATNAAFEPYEYYEGENIVGIDAEFAKAICDLLGYELVIEDMEFDSITAAIQSGKADFGAAGMTITEDRLLSVDFTEPYTTATQVIIVKK